MSTILFSNSSSVVTAIGSSKIRGSKNSNSSDNNTVVVPMKLEDHIQRLSDDTSVSLSQKNACFKTLTAILKNLIDPTKGGVIGKTGLNKYRKFKSNNPKLQSRLFFNNNTTTSSTSSSSFNSMTASVLDLLLDPNFIGMQRIPYEDDTTKKDIIKVVMEDPPSNFIQDTIGMRVLPALRTAQSVMALQLIAESAAAAPAGTAPQWDESGAFSIPTKDKLSDKKTASRLLESKELLERKQNKFDKIRTDSKVAIVAVNQLLSTVPEEEVEDEDEGTATAATWPSAAMATLSLQPCAVDAASSSLSSMKPSLVGAGNRRY